MEADAIEYVRRSRLIYENTSSNYAGYRHRLALDNARFGRLGIIFGFRGVGKTTMLFQSYLKADPKKRLYIHAEEAALLRFGILEIVDAAAKIFGQDMAIYIDEINHVPEWEEHLKVAYDKYVKMEFLVSGSSSMELLGAKRLLARRAVFFHAKPLSFREYVWLRHGIRLDKFVIDENSFESAIRYDIYIREKLGKLDLVELCTEYMERNITYLLESPEETLHDLVEKAIFHDIAKTENLESNTLSKFERLIFILSASNKVTYENISKDLGISKSQVQTMLNCLERADLVRRVHPYVKGKGVARKEWKYFFMAPAIRKLYAKKIGMPQDQIRGYMMEDIFAANFENICFADVDFVVDGMLVEIGSASKGFGQQKMEKRTEFAHLRRIIVYLGQDITNSNSIVKIPFYIFFSAI